MATKDVTQFTPEELAEYLKDLQIREEKVRLFQSDLVKRESDILMLAQKTQCEAMAALNEEKARADSLQQQLEMEIKIRERTESEKRLLVDSLANRSLDDDVGRLINNRATSSPNKSDKANKHDNFPMTSETSNSIFEQLERMREDISALRTSSSVTQKESNHAPSALALSDMSSFSNIIIKEALANVPRFDGRNLLSFIRSSKRAIDLTPKTLHGEVIKLLKNKLDDSCYALVGTAHFDHFDDFVNNLKRIFSPNETLNNLRGKLDAIKKGHNETLMSYVNRVLDIKEAMINRKRLDSNNDLTEREVEEIEREVIEGFRDGLAPDFRNRLCSPKDLTLSQIIDDAIHTDKQLERDKEKHSYNPIGRNNYWSDSNRRDYNNKQNNNRENNYEGYRNYNNHEYGRPNNFNGTPNFNRSNNFNRVNGDGNKFRAYRCNFCNKLGHIRRDCYAFKRQQGNETNVQGKGATCTDNEVRPVNAITVEHQSTVSN